MWTQDSEGETRKGLFEKALTDLWSLIAVLTIAAAMRLVQATRPFLSFRDTNFSNRTFPPFQQLNNMVISKDSHYKSIIRLCDCIHSHMNRACNESHIQLCISYLTM